MRAAWSNRAIASIYVAAVCLLGFDMGLAKAQSIGILFEQRSWLHHDLLYGIGDSSPGMTLNGDLSILTGSGLALVGTASFVQTPLKYSVFDPDFQHESKGEMTDMDAGLGLRWGLNWWIAPFIEFGYTYGQKSINVDNQSSMDRDSNALTYHSKVNARGINQGPYASLGLKLGGTYGLHLQRRELWQVTRLTSITLKQSSSVNGAPEVVDAADRSLLSHYESITGKNYLSRSMSWLIGMYYNF